MDMLHRAASTIEPTLPDLPPWSKLTPTSADDLLLASTEGAFRRGDEVVADFGIVLSGAFAIEHHLSDGRRVLSELFHRGCLADLQRSSRVRQGRLIALKASSFLAIDEAWHDRHLHDYPDIAAAVAVQLRDQLSSQRDHATDLAVKTPFEKLASVLFEFQRWPEANFNQPGGQALRIPIHRVDIADYIGVKPETLSRAVRCLERERLIQLPKPDQVLVTEPFSLRCIANGSRPRRSTKRVV